MFTGPKIETNGLKLHIDPSNTKNESIKSVGRITQLESITIDETKDSKKNSKTASLNGSNSRISFAEVLISSDWSVSISFRTNISTSSINFNQTLFGNDNNDPGIIEINSDINVDGRVQTYVSIVYSEGVNKRVYRSYISPFNDKFVSSQLQDSFWMNNPIMLTITLNQTIDGGIYKIYIDDELKDSVDFTNFRTFNFFKSNQIGSQGNLKVFSGDIFLTSVYDKTLSINDIKSTFNAFKSRFNKIVKRRFFTIRSMWYNKYDNGDYELYEKFIEDKSFTRESLLLERNYPTLEQYGKNPNRGASLVDVIISEKGDLIISEFKSEKKSGKIRKFKKDNQYYLNIVRKYISQN